MPYEQDDLGDGLVVRHFSVDVPEEELKWHRDAEDRIVRVLEDTDWMFQFDNELPRRMSGEFRIPAGVYHRVIKGSGGLIVEIRKL